MKYNYKLLCTIKELGKDLSSINLLIVGAEYEEDGLIINYIIEGCPKLKALTLESLRGWIESPFDDNNQDLFINKESLEALYRCCKELKDLKFTKVMFLDIFTQDDIKKIFPDCNVELKECEFDEESLDDSSWMSDDSYDSYYDDDWFDDYGFNNSWDVSFDDGEQDSNFERAYEGDETIDILDKFDGGEIELMFSENYGEGNKDENDD